MTKRLDDGLFRLIKQMSSSEKRHFTMNFGQDNKVPVYYQIFEMINGMDKYDPDKLKATFPDNLSRNKSILYEHILHSMRDYERGKNERMQMKEKLIDAKYLLERGLNEQGEKRLKEAKKLAKKFGDYLALLEINLQERSLLRVTSNDALDYKLAINDSIAENKVYLEKLGYEFECLEDYDLLFGCQKTKNSVEDQGQYNTFKEKFPVPMPEDAIQDYGLMAERRFYQSGALWHHMEGDEKTEDCYCKKILEWWAKQDIMRKEADYWYVADLSNILQAYLKWENQEEIEKIFALISEIKTSNQHTKRLIFHALPVNQFNASMVSKEYKQAKSMVPKLENGLKNFDLNPATKLSIFHNVLMLYFILWDTKKLIIWNKKISSMLGNSHRKDIQHFSLLLAVLLDFEKAEYLPEMSSYKTAYTHFYRKLRLDKNTFEKVVLKFFLKTSSIPEGDREDAYKLFKEQLEKLRTSQLNNAYIPGLDVLILWTMSKISGEEIQSIIKNF